MDQLPPLFRRTTFWVWTLFSVLALIFFIAFFPEFRWIWLTLRGWYLVLIGQADVELPPLDLVARSAAALVFNGLMLLILVEIWVRLVARQSILPVSNWKDVSRTMAYFREFLQGGHGPAFFVRNGMIADSPEELKRPGAGVAVVHFNSAIVLEERIPAGRARTGLLDLVGNVLGDPLVDIPVTPPRAAGPGLVFHGSIERIRGIVDLRRQFRNQAQVRGYTRNGIELSTSISTLFTVGESPEILFVTYRGERIPENLSVVSLQVLGSDRVSITAFAPELDLADQREIHAFVQSQAPFRATAPLALRRSYPESLPSPFEYNPARVFAAVYSQARDAQQGDLSPWQELPPLVALDIFRELLSHEDYDHLYETPRPASAENMYDQALRPPPDRPIYTAGAPGEAFPLRGLQYRFRLAVRNQGILGFQYIEDSRGLELQTGIYPLNRINRTEARLLASSRVLRDRGIKVISAGFGDLFPVSDAIYKQRLDSWRATWERDAEVVRASADLEAMRIKTHARAESQREMGRLLARILQRRMRREALVLRVLQAIENAAVDGRTRQLLPGETINIIKTVREWFRDRNGNGGGSSGGRLPDVLGPGGE
ncbi:MAG TPA: hypothetical protein VMT46_02155 [Anaerolineaceae bacterium]|nr:hypothetical protein [Anaerolineaceae bacterium]